jgi:hypothetical protein
MDRESVEEIKRHFGIVAEELRGDIRAVAEGQTRLRGDFDTFRVEVRKEFEETRAMIRLSYGELERRIVDLETGMHDLRSRVARIETHLTS